jgi:hypothetical protein
VVGGVVAVLATASVVIGQLMGSGGDTDSSGAARAEWNRIVVLDERDGRVTVTDEQGEEVGRIESGVDSPTGSGVVDDSMLIVSADAVAVIDLDRADDEPTTTPSTDPSLDTTTTATETTDPAGDTAETETGETGADTDGADGTDTDGATTTYGFGADRVITPAGSALTLIAPRADGGRGVLVHGPSGEVIDTDSFAPVVGARYEFADARATPSGRNVLVTDSGNFQSVLFSFDRDQPSYFPGLGLAVGDDVVITAQNVGNNATINVFDHAGEALATGQTSSVRAGMVGGDGAVLITVDGAVVTLDLANGDTSDGDDLEIGTVTSGVVTTSGDRLVVSGAEGTAVVDAEAGTVGTYSGTRLPDPDRPPIGSQCVALVPLAADPEPQLRVVDVTDGTSIVDAVDVGVVDDGTERTPLHPDATGCTIALATSSGFELVTPDGTQSVPSSDELIALAPDASRVVAERTGRLLLLDAFSTSDEPADPIDIGRQGGVVHFTRS